MRRLSAFLVEPSPIDTRATRLATMRAVEANAAIAAFLPARASHSSCACFSSTALLLGRSGLVLDSRRDVLRVVRLDDAREALADRQHEVHGRRGEADEGLHALAIAYLGRIQL